MSYTSIFVLFLSVHSSATSRVTDAFRIYLALMEGKMQKLLAKDEHLRTNYKIFI
jgi:hypothetical protein